METWIQAHLEAHNKIRLQNSLPFFSISKHLESLAQEHSINMKKQHKLFHEVKGNFNQNIAQGKKNFINKPHLAVDLWMTDNHKLPILNPNFSRIGCHYSIDSDNNVYICCNYN